MKAPLPKLLGDTATLRHAACLIINASVQVVVHTESQAEAHVPWRCCCEPGRLCRLDCTCVARHSRKDARQTHYFMHACMCMCMCVDVHIQKQFAGTTSVVCVMQAAASQARVRILWHDSEPLSWYLPTGAYDTTSLLFQHFIHAHTQVHHTCCKA